MKKSLLALGILLSPIICPLGLAASVQTIAGTGTKGFSTNAMPALQAELNDVSGLIKTRDGQIFFCDTHNHAIRKISNNIVYLVAGTGAKGYSGDGKPAAAAQLNEPYEVRLKDGELFWVERLTHTIRKMGTNQIISSVAGNGKTGFAGDDGPFSSALFSQPHSIQFDARGNLLVCDIGNHRIRSLNFREGKVTTFSGSGEKIRPPDGAPFGKAPLLGPRAIDFDREGNLWLALREGNSIYKLDLKTGTIHQMAGTGEKGFVDGPAKKAKLNGPKGISVGSDGHVYFADTESHTIRRINLIKNIVETVVGTGQPGDGPDGDPLKCQLNRPHGIFADTDGTLLIGDSSNHKIRRYVP